MGWLPKAVILSTVFIHSPIFPLKKTSHSSKTYLLEKKKLYIFLAALFYSFAFMIWLRLKCNINKEIARYQKQEKEDWQSKVEKYINIHNFQTVRNRGFTSPVLKEYLSQARPNAKH